MNQTVLPDQTEDDSFVDISHPLEIISVKVKENESLEAGRMITTIIVILFLFHPTLTSTMLNTFK